MNSEESRVNRRSARKRPLHCSLFTIHSLALLTSSAAGQIQDNSFLLEEAYNQETGVVQHISTFVRSSDASWQYTFTQEWPLGGIRHQLSYTVPLESAEGFGTGLGDIAFNYRYQLVGDPKARTVAAPRLSLLLPTGDENEDRGTGGVGLQLNLPLTLVLGNRLVTHWNAGTTITPSARNALGETARTHSYNLGASLIWLLRPAFNLLVETAWQDVRRVAADGRVVSETDWVLSPGIRWSFDMTGDLQIVPGIAYAIGVGEGPDDNAFLAYLSFEHPFKR